MAIETQTRMAIRDAVNRPIRKLFYWGGLSGRKSTPELPKSDNQSVRVQRLVQQFIIQITQGYASLHIVSDAIAQSSV